MPVLLQRLVLALAFMCCGWAFAAPSVMANDSPPTGSPVVYLFWVKGCPHCAHEIRFLQAMQRAQPDLEVRYLEITHDNQHRKLFLEVMSKLGVSEAAVPLTIVGNHVWMGYSDDAAIGKQLEQRIADCRVASCPDFVAALMQAQAPTDRTPQAVRAAAPDKMQVPVLGEISLRDLSLPALTVVLGALDGFNPCAMWTLVFLIGLLLGMRDRARMWVLGSAFIIGSAAVYFVFMAAWLNLLLFLGSLLLIRVVIALVALAGGLYYLREYFTNPQAVCPVTAPERRQRVFQCLRSLAQDGRFVVALLGILALAFLVNLVELLCSAGIPAVYTQILAMHALPTWQYYAYLLLYILVFMADDLLVFVAAMLTLRVSGLSSQYARYSHLIGGLLLLAIGALMLLRPELLMFG